MANHRLCPGCNLGPKFPPHVGRSAKKNWQQFRPYIKKSMATVTQWNPELDFSPKLEAFQTVLILDLYKMTYDVVRNLCYEFCLYALNAVWVIHICSFFFPDGRISNLFFNLVCSFFSVAALYVQWGLSMMLRHNVYNTGHSSLRSLSLKIYAWSHIA